VPEEAELALGRPRFLPRIDAGLGEAVACVGVLLFLNGVTRMVVDHVSTHGFLPSLSATFGISAIVWASACAGLALLLREPGPAMTPNDRRACAIAFAACLAPMESACWIALAALSAYAVRRSPPGSDTHRGAWIMLGVTVPVFWSKAIFFALSDQLLTVDAVLASTMLWSDRAGNTVRLADDSGFLWIAPACSSFANVSLGVLAWIAILRWRGLAPTRRRFAWCLLAIAGVVLVNGIRIALIGHFPAWYEFLHNGFGATVTGWVTLAVILATCSHGIGHGDRVAP